MNITEMMKNMKRDKGTEIKREKNVEPENNKENHRNQRKEEIEKNK